jgi:hypothetical protein
VENESNAAENIGISRTGRRTIRREQVLYFNYCDLSVTFCRLDSSELTVTRPQFVVVMTLFLTGGTWAIVRTPLSIAEKIAALLSSKGFRR